MRVRFASLAFLFLTAASLADTRSLFEPNSYSTAGALNVSAGQLVFDTTALTVKLDGTTIGSGVLAPQPNGIASAVFAFDAIEITGTASVQFKGARPVALLSKGTINVTPDLDVSSPAFLAGGPGGYSGGNLYIQDLNNSLNGDPQAYNYVPQPGAGPGGGVPGGDTFLFVPRIGVATGGGFGGAGGWYRSGGFIGSPYVPGGAVNGDLLSSLEGGSGGASNLNVAVTSSEDSVSPGGGGGGAIALVASDAITVGVVRANGSSANASNGVAAGSGAGGGILIKSPTLSFNSLEANGGSTTVSSFGTSGGGGRIAILDSTSSFAFGSSLSAVSVAGGALAPLATGAIPATAGVITLSPQTFIATGNDSLDGSPLVRQVAGQPTYEVEVRRNLTVATGARVTLGRDQPLDLLTGLGGASSVALTLNNFFSDSGVFDTASYSQRIGTLNGGGELRLSDGGRLTIDGAGSTFNGRVVGAGTLAISPGARLDLAENFGVGHVNWTGTAEVGGTLGIHAGVFKPSVVSTTAAAKLIKDNNFSTVDLAGDLSSFRGVLELAGGVLRVTQTGALNTPAVVRFADSGTQTLDLLGRPSTVGALDGGAAGAAIELNGAVLTVGAGDRSGAYGGAVNGAGGGIVKVGAGLLELNGPLNFTGSTSVRDGSLTINSPMGSGGSVRVESSGQLYVGASIARSIAGVGPSSVITVTSPTPVSIGTPTSFLGFINQGELQIGAKQVTLNSAGAVRPGALTTLGAGMPGSEVPGLLAAPNGAVIDFGEAIVGYGTLSTPNSLAKRVVINGAAVGQSVTNPLTLTGYVTGSGSFDNVVFTGTFSPGNSPAIVTAGSMAIAPSGMLEMEIGGLAPGSAHDKIEASGTLAMAGTLRLSLLAGFSPTAGQAFDLFDSSTTSGGFAAFSLPSLSPGLRWDTTQLLTSGVVSVRSGLPGDYNDDGAVDAADYTVFRDGLGVSFSPGDYAVWANNFGAAASPSVSFAVPEVSAAALALLAIGSATGGLRHKRRENAAMR